LDETGMSPLLPPPISKSEIGGGMPGRNAELVVERHGADIGYNKTKPMYDG
jgi:hypothetical protein